MVPKEWYKMRNRVIFPLRDEMGGLIGFAARKQPDGDPDEPKYRNTSVEEGYRKSENLYALNLAKEAIRQDGFAFSRPGRQSKADIGKLCRRPSSIGVISA